MKPTKLLIISPDPEVTARLQETLSRVKSRGWALILRRYPSAEQLAKLLRIEQQSKVIISIGDSETALGLIKQLRADYPEILVAAVHTTDMSNLALAAIRAGAKDCFVPPFEVEPLERLLQADYRPAHRVAGRFISFSEEGLDRPIKNNAEPAVRLPRSDLQSRKIFDAQGKLRGGNGTPGKRASSEVRAFPVLQNTGRGLHGFLASPANDSTLAIRQI